MNFSSLLRRPVITAALGNLVALGTTGDAPNDLAVEPAREARPTVAAASRDVTYTGVLEWVERSQLVLNTGSKRVTFRVENGVEVWLDDKPAKLEQLAAGQWASIDAIELEDTVLVAKRVTAHKNW